MMTIKIKTDHERTCVILVFDCTCRERTIAAIEHNLRQQFGDDILFIVWTNSNRVRIGVRRQSRHHGGLEAYFSLISFVERWKSILQRYTDDTVRARV